MSDDDLFRAVCVDCPRCVVCTALIPAMHTHTHTHTLAAFDSSSKKAFPSSHHRSLMRLLASFVSLSLHALTLHPEVCCLVCFFFLTHTTHTHTPSENEVYLSDSSLNLAANESDVCDTTFRVQIIWSFFHRRPSCLRLLCQESFSIVPSYALSRPSFHSRLIHSHCILKSVVRLPFSTTHTHTHKPTHTCIVTHCSSPWSSSLFMSPGPPQVEVSAGPRWNLIISSIH